MNDTSKSKEQRTKEQILNSYPHTECFHFTPGQVLLAMEEYALQQRAELEKCLGELVFLKDLKDNYGKTAYYIVSMPAAWDKAKSLLNPDKTDL